MNQSPTPRVIEVKPNMDFPDAMREVIKGKKVRRMEWEDKDVYFFMDEFLSIHKSDGKNYQLIVSSADMQSDDYIIIN